MEKVHILVVAGVRTKRQKGKDILGNEATMEAIIPTDVCHFTLVKSCEMCKSDACWVWTMAFQCRLFNCHQRSLLEGTLTKGEASVYGSRRGLKRNLGAFHLISLRVRTGFKQ